MPSYLFPSPETESVARRLAAGERPVSFDEARRVTPSVPLPKPSPRADEASTHAHKLRVQNAETAPPTFGEYPIGTLAADSYGDVYELREIRLDDPRLAEVEIPGRFVVEKYVDWIRAGHRPPPIRVMETEKGSFTVHDGHHRMAALRLAGASSTRAWVALTINRMLEGGGLVMPEALTIERARAAVG